MGIKQKKKKSKIFFKIAYSKKLRFSKLPILEKISPKFHGLVLGLAVLIGAKNIDVAQPIWL